MCTGRLILLAMTMALTACGGGGSAPASPPPTVGTSGSDVSGRGAPIVSTREGPVSGKIVGAQYEYLGIPYAAAPVGNLRFAPPAPAELHTGVLAALDYGNPCPQPGAIFGQVSTGEDCLYLNVYRPTGAGPWPVMFWIHGGAFVNGSGGAGYDPSQLVARGIVVVTINYRLGILGFLAHPALTAESADGGSGDYGLMDQQAALRWVNDNISEFAGDPGNITVFGESAGGHSVLSLLASPLAAGLFEKAIVESGSYQPAQRTLTQAESLGDTYATALGCKATDDAAEVSCLRSVPVSTMLTVQGADQFIPNTRPRLLPRSIADALSSGQFNHVPVMEGTNRDEWRFFVATTELQTGTPLQAAEYQSAIQSNLLVSASRAQAVAAEYTLSDYDNPSVALGAIGTDAIFACNALTQASALSQYVDIYAYEFGDRNAPPLLPPVSFDYGAAHAFEISYVLSSVSTFRSLGGTDEQLALSATMVGYWTRFAKTGDPNGNGSVDWTPFTSDAQSMIDLVPPTPQPLTGMQFDSEHHCSTFWDL